MSWRKFYAADPQIVGKTLTIKGQAYTILGVMPRGFSFPFVEDAADLVARRNRSRQPLLQ